MDEQTARNIIREAAELATAIADATPTAVDDQVAAVMTTIVTSDHYWSIAWRVIEKAISYFDRENQHLIVESDGDTSLLAQEAGIDPATIIVVIQAIVEIIKWRRNR